MSWGSKATSNAFTAAVATGATVCSVQFLLMGGLSAWGTKLGFVAFAFLFIWLIAACCFVVGLLFIGLPAWAGLAALGWMSRGAAIAAGALLTTLTGGLLGSLGGLEAGLQSAAFMVIPGAVAGWTLHHVAYGGSKPV